MVGKAITLKWPNTLRIPTTDSLAQTLINSVSLHCWEQSFYFKISNHKGISPDHSLVQWYVQSPVPLGLIRTGKLELNTFISITFSILFWVAHYSSQCVEIATCFFISVVQSHAGEFWLTKKSGFRT